MIADPNSIAPKKIIFAFTMSILIDAAQCGSLIQCDENTRHDRRRRDREHHRLLQKLDRDVSRAKTGWPLSAIRHQQHRSAKGDRLPGSEQSGGYDQVSFE